MSRIYGIGTDICDVRRIRASLERHGERFAANIPDAKLHVMQGCGHWPQFEDAPTFNKLSLDFLTR